MKTKSKVHKLLEAAKQKRTKEFKKEKQDRWSAKPARNIMGSSTKSNQWWNK